MDAADNNTTSLQAPKQYNQICIEISKTVNGNESFRFGLSLLFYTHKVNKLI